MTAAIDTNVLLDILLPDPKHSKSSYLLLNKYMKSDRLIISEIVYSELASQFSEKKLLTKFLNDTYINLVVSSTDALWVAAKSWKTYTKNRGRWIQCSKCGKKETVKCSDCNSTISYRQHIISDFLIAGHAITEADILLTRDRGFYQAYFSELKTNNEL